MRATLILLFVALGFQASAETRAICSVTGTHLLKGAQLTEQSDLVDTLYIEYNEETLSMSDGTLPMMFKAVSSNGAGSFIYSRHFVAPENGVLSAVVIMNPACNEEIAAEGILRTIHTYAITEGTVLRVSADCSCPS